MIASQANAQLKVGTDPTNIHKSAILELESKKQGLLLPRFDDFTAITALGAPIPDGMIVYKGAAADGKAGLYVRKGGAWVLLAGTDDGWSRNGNNATAGEFIGTNNAIPFSIKGGGVEGIVVDNGYTFLKKLDHLTAPNSGVDVVMYDQTTGKVSYRTINETAFSSAINSLNGLTNAAQTLVTATPNDYTFTKDATTGEHKLTIAAQQGVVGAGQIGAGLLTLADYQRFDKATKALVIGSFSSTAVADGLSITAADPAVPGDQPKLVLHPADRTHPGAVTIDAQEFDGLKTFIKKVSGLEDLDIAKTGTFGTGLTVTTGGADVHGDSKVTGSLSVLGANGNLSVAGTSNLAGTLDVTGATKLASTLNVTGATTLTSTLDVTGVTKLANTLDVAEKATLAKDLQVKGNTQLDNTLTLTNIADGAATDNVVLLRQNDATGTVVKRKLSASAFKDLTFKADHAGLDLAVAQDNDEVTISIPIAAPSTPGGLVSNAAQSFAGAKKFGNEVSIQKNVSIGDTTNAATSTLQVTGSVAMSITTLTAAGSYTVLPTDNTILVGANGASTIVLPNATTCTGRIYTIKKIPAAGAADDANIDNDVKITSAGGTLEGGTKLQIYSDWTFYTVQSNGTNWYVIKK